jgi:hypothetical protein
VRKRVIHERRGRTAPWGPGRWRQLTWPRVGAVRSVEASTSPGNRAGCRKELVGPHRYRAGSLAVDVGDGVRERAVGGGQRRNGSHRVIDTLSGRWLKSSMTLSRSFVASRYRLRPLLIPPERSATFIR